MGWGVMREYAVISEPASEGEMAQEAIREASLLPTNGKKRDVQRSLGVRRRRCGSYGIWVRSMAVRSWFWRRISEEWSNSERYLASGFRENVRRGRLKKLRGKENAR